MGDIIHVLFTSQNIQPSTTQDSSLLCTFAFAVSKDKAGTNSCCSEESPLRLSYHSLLSVIYKYLIFPLFLFSVVHPPQVQNKSFGTTLNSESLCTRDPANPGTISGYVTHWSCMALKSPATEHKTTLPIFTYHETLSLLRDVATWISVGGSSITGIVIGRAIAVAINE